MNTNILAAAVLLALSAFGELTTFDERVAASNELQGLARQGNLDEIRARLKSPDAKTRFLALGSLNLLGETAKAFAAEAAPHLKDPSEEIQGAALWYFVKSRIPGQNAAITLFLKSGNSKFRRHAVSYIGRFGSPAERRALKALLNDPVKAVQNEVLYFYPPAKTTPPSSKYCSEAFAHDMEVDATYVAVEKGVIKPLKQWVILERDGEGPLKLDGAQVAAHIGRRVQLTGCKSDHDDFHITGLSILK